MFQYRQKDAEQETEKHFAAVFSFMETTQPFRPVKITVDVRMTDGMYIRQQYLSYERLKKLVEKLVSSQKMAIN